MAPAGRGRGCRGGAGARALQSLLLLGTLVCARATEHYSPLSLLKQELQHRQQQEAPAGGGCPQSGDWVDQYPAECGEWARGRAAAGRGDGPGVGLPPSRFLEAESPGGGERQARGICVGTPGSVLGPPPCPPVVPRPAVRRHCSCAAL